MKRLPKGLQEYQASLWDCKWAGELLPRLVELHERALSAAKAKAAAIADNAFEMAVAGWTVKRLQEATGYDDE